MHRWANKLDQYRELEKDGRHTEKQNCNVRRTSIEIIKAIMQHWSIKAKDPTSITSYRDAIYDKNSRRHLDRL